MNLLEFLKKNENCRKIFGKRELKIIEKQLMGVNLTQSEKNRLSRDIRKKFKFISETCKFKDKFDLKKGQEINNIVEETKEIILEDKQAGKIKKILLFGSVVKNKLTLRSDIDFAVKFDKISKKQAGKFRIRIHGKVNNKVDVQVFRFLPEKIKKQIKKNSKFIYKK